MVDGRLGGSGSRRGGGEEEEEEKRKKFFKDIVVIQECVPPATANRLTAISRRESIDSEVRVIKKLCA